MGYLTHYQLSWTQSQSSNPLTIPCEACNGSGKILIPDPVKNFVENRPFIYNHTEPIASSLDEAVKWYEHEDDMKRLSFQFPDTLFRLSGEGEEPGDIWVKYFKDGKMQAMKAEIKFADFNEADLT